MAGCCAHNEHSEDAVVDVLSKLIVDGDLTDESKLRLENFNKKLINENLDICSIVFEEAEEEFVPENHVHDLPSLENRQNKLTPLMLAVFKGRTAIVQYLLENYSPDLEVEGILIWDQTPVEGVTALWLAVSFNKLELASLLLQHGAQINHCTK